MITNKSIVSTFCFFALITIQGCGATTKSSPSSTTEDTSVSGAAAGAIGGAIASSSSGGTMASLNLPGKNIAGVSKAALHSELAMTACPTLLSASGSGCTQTSSTVDTLTYSSCSFGNALATWNGTLDVTVASGSITCGTFPTLSSVGSISRQFVTGASPSSGTRTSASGIQVTIDDATANLNNYQGDTIGAIIGSGYGSQVTFNGSGARTAVTIDHHLSCTAFDHSLTGQLSISESGTTRTVAGTLTTYHNKVKMKGTTTFSSVVYNNTCCQPVSGTITTTFATTSQSPNNAITTAMNGKTETLTISSCGVASYTDYSGVTSTIAMTGCY